MKKLIIILVALFLSGCATPPPKSPDAKDPISSVPEGKAVVVFFRLRQGQLLESLLFEKQKVDDLKLLSVAQADTQTRQGEIDSTRIIELDGSRFEEAQNSEKLKALLREAESRYKRANETQTRYQTVLPQYGVDSF